MVLTETRHEALASVDGCDVRLTEMNAVEWDRRLIEFRDATIDQCAVTTDGKWSKGNVSHCAVMHGDSILGGASVVTFKVPLLDRGVSYIKFGPLWRRRDREPVPAHYRAVVEAVFQEFALKRGHMLTILPPPNPSWAHTESKMLEEMGFAVRRSMFDPYRYLIDLSLEPEMIMAGFLQKTRYNLKKALRHGLVIEEYPAQQGYDLFAQMHAGMVGRKRFLNQDAVHLLPAMAERLADFRPRVFFGVNNGAPVCGAVIGRFGDIATYIYGASTSEALTMRAGYALQWHIINVCRATGAQWYDLGGDARDPGLRQFKQGLVGSTGSILTYAGEFDRSADYIGGVAGDLIYAGRALWRIARSRA